MMITHDLGVVAEMCDKVLVMYAGKIIEVAEVVELFKNPKHPYTIGLLKSKPVLGKNKDKRLYSIPGQVPNQLEYQIHVILVIDVKKYVINVELRYLL